MAKISIILPTYNEAENLPKILPKLEKVLSRYDYEVLVVDDDSPDKTWLVARQLQSKYPNLMVIRRTENRGLAQSVVEGMRQATGDYYFVMDADMQHDETILPQMIDALVEADVVIGSRHVEEGSTGDWSLLRKLISKTATLLADFFLPVKVKDPMSGYFGLRKEVFEEVRDKLRPRGFKILIEILGHLRNPRVVEVGYVFKVREYGESKLSHEVMLDYLITLYNLRFGKLIPIRFIKYSLVGLSGILVNQAFLWFFREIIVLPPEYAVIPGIEASVISNFFLNNIWTYKDAKLKGVSNIMIGLAKFHVISALGIFINYAVYYFLYNQFQWNLYVANLIGILVASLWNYISNTFITWKAGH